MPPTSDLSTWTGRDVAGAVLGAMKGGAVRILQLMLVALGISSLMFVLLRLSGDPVSLLLPLEASAAEIETLRRNLGLDAPLWIQYLRFLEGVVRLDFGESIVFRVPAFQIALERFPATLQLTAAALAIGLVVGLPLGVIGALNSPAPVRAVVTLTTVVGQSMPSFWMGILLILVFSVTLRLLPSFGNESPQHLVLPAITLAAPMVARIIRLVRASLMEELGLDYVRTARAKGLTTMTMIRRHALPNVMIPLLTLIGVDVGILIGGAVITESIFAWPGIGRQLVKAVLGRDYPVVQATVFLIAILVVVINMTMDVMYRRLDPRVRTA